MKFCLGFILLVVFAAGTLAEDEFDLSLALDEDPAEKPTEKPKPPPQKPNAGGDKGFHLESALDTDPKPADKPAVKPADKPSKGGEGELDLGDALLPDLDPKPDKPAVKPPKSGGGGGSFDDSDLFELAPNKPDGGHSAGGRAVDPAYDPNGGADQPQDPNLLWGPILKMLNANMPEEFYVWISNLKQTVTPLLERALEMLRAVP